MNTTPHTLEELNEAKRLALAFVNSHRPADKPAKRISSLWWSMHGPEFLQKARETLNTQRKGQQP